MVDESVLKAVLSRLRESLAAQLGPARGMARVAVLRLQDALDRLLYMLSVDTRLTKYRAWQGDPKAVDVGALLHAACVELMGALREASAYLDDVPRAALGRFVDDLTVYVAHVVDPSRGTESPLIVSSSSSSVVRPPPAGKADYPRDTAVLEGVEDDVNATPDNVSFSAAAPVQARPGDGFVARLAAYLPEDEAEVRAVLAQAVPGRPLSATPKQGGLRRGTPVEIVLEGTGLTVDRTPGRAVQGFVWDGQPRIVEFEVQVPADAAPTRMVLRFYVRLAGVVLERVLLDLEISVARPASVWARHEVSTKRLPTTAFASYSSLDRLRVLDRVAAIRIAAGIDVFLDCLDLNPSEKWEPRLRDEIDTRDLFILFWSSAAAQSRWVTWEWERALVAKGLDAMQIQPLENGIQPPRKLRAVHMADAAMDVRQAELARRSSGNERASENTSVGL